MKIFEGEVKFAWVDYNGHMGDFAYSIVFSDAITAFMDLIGVDEVYRTSTQRTIYTLDMRIAYLQECHKGQRFYVEQQLLDKDHKRYHTFMRMVDAVSGEVLAVSEQLLMHMQQTDGSAPKAVNFDDAVQAKLNGYFEAQRAMPKPDWVGSVIGIRRK